MGDLFLRGAGLSRGDYFNLQYNWGSFFVFLKKIDLRKGKVIYFPERGTMGQIILRTLNQRIHVFSKNKASEPNIMFQNDSYH